MRVDTYNWYVGVGDRSETFDFLDNDRPYVVHAGGGNDFIYGYGYGDYLYGQAGRDQVLGWDGDDVLFGDFSSDDSSGGTWLGGDSDLLRGGRGRDLIFASVGDDFALGDEDEDTIFGGTGNDILWGGYGADRLEGEAGNDLLCGHSGTLISVPDAYKLTIFATHNGLTDGAFGEPFEIVFDYFPINEARDDLGADTLDGGAGNDTLSGGYGADLMIGGTGDDTFIVEDAHDVVIEHAGGGRDVVFTTVSYTLSSTAQVEELSALYSTSTAGLKLTGSSTANAIYGTAGANVLKGLGGNDKLYGLAGKDRLEGGTGNDVLSGGTGADMLIGGSGRDSFVFDSRLGSSNVDRIVDFNVAHDTIILENAIFKKVGAAGRLKADAFQRWFDAWDSTDRIIYDFTTGKLYYDPDGSGAANQVQFAQLAPGLFLTAANFYVI